jgi:hypothetical protein
MEKKYRTREGDEIVATCKLGLVRQLNEGSRFGEHPFVDTFMIFFARREFEYSGKKVSTLSTDDFVDSLIEIGYLTVVD